MWLPMLATVFYFVGMTPLTLIILWAMAALDMLGEGFTNKYPVENNEDLDHRGDRSTLVSDVMVSAFPGRV